MSKIHIIEHKHNKWFYDHFQINEWMNVHQTVYADVEIPSIDSIVISTWKVFVYIRLQSGHLVSLPLRFYSTSRFSASIDAVIKIGKLRIIWTLYETVNNFEPHTAEVVVFAIDRLESMHYPELNFLNFNDVREQFELP